MQALFWIALAIVVYTYLGYGLLLLLLNSLSKQERLTSNQILPDITFIVPAYNEAEVINAKIKNTLSLNYPPGKLTYLFVTDGSNDGTAEIIATYPQLLHLHQPERRGKSAAINRAMKEVTTSIVVFSDANTLVHPDSLQKLAARFADSTIGGVSGEKRVIGKESSAVGIGENLYWRYESALKQANADFYTIVGAAGELFAMRTALFRPIHEDIILDDFFISAQVCLQGFRFGYEKNAIAVETSSATIQEEQKRKVRISAGCYQALVRLPGLMNPFQNGRIAFQYISHRVLRWVVCPLLLPLLFVVNLLLCLHTVGGLYPFLLIAQAGFYSLAFTGVLFPVWRRHTVLLLIPYYFTFMVASQYRGFLRFITGRQPATWEKAHRETTTPPALFSETVNPDGHQISR